MQIFLSDINLNMNAINKKKYNYKTKNKSLFLILIFMIGTLINLAYLATDNYFKSKYYVSNATKNNTPLTENKNKENLVKNKIFFWEEFLTLNPTYMTGLIRLSNLYIQGKEYEKARNVLKKTIILSPNNQEAQHTLKTISTK